ncbi:MAG: membrane bound O-acyl transferase family-domain-containing protein [Planctomycetota bacterium]
MISQHPPWFIMWMLAVVIFSICKAMTAMGISMSTVPMWRKFSYFVLWPGMDCRAFLFEEVALGERPTSSEWLAAFFKTGLGVTLFFGVARFIPAEHEMIVGWAGMIGLMFMLHFGTFHLISCFWRARGVRAQLLMRAPLASTSLSEFWGRRWNTAFRDLTHRFIFKPLTARIGSRWALFVGFAASGIVHDAIISGPSGGGFGWPTLFFLLQAAGMFIERSRGGRALGLGSGWRGHVFTLVMLVLPLYGLFHPPFVRNVIVPFMRVVGAV